MMRSPNEVKVNGIIIAGSENTVEALKKELRAKIRDPREAEFERLRAEGFDSETAALMSGAVNLDEGRQADMILRNAMYDSPSEKFESRIIETTNMAVRQVTTGVGSALGSAASMVVLRTVVQNSGAFMFGGVVLGGAVAGVMVGKAVGVTLGKGWAIAAVANVAMATGILAFAMARKK